MLQFSFSVLVTLSLEVLGQFRQVSYSFFDRTVTEDSLTILFYGTGSIFQCGGFCVEDSYCIEFLYNAEKNKCFGIHEENSEGYSYLNVIPNADEVQRFHKDKNWIAYNGHLYLYEENKITWHEAWLECEERGSYFVKIESLDESKWLATYFIYNENCGDNLHNYCTAWTGGNDIKNEGEYVWNNSSTPLTFTNWHNLEPSLYNPNEASPHDCIDLLRNGEWNDRPCSYLNPFICEK